MLVGNSMTCTGNLIGFNTSGFKALFRSLKVQVPFTEATLLVRILEMPCYHTYSYMTLMTLSLRTEILL